MRPILTLLMPLAVSAGMAQTLTTANILPEPGTAFIYHGAAYQPAGVGGAGQNWDFSTLEAGETSVTEYMLPAATGHGAEFPDADLAAFDVDGGIYTFYGVDVDGLYILGSHQVAAIPYQDTERYLALPCSYNTTWSDPFSAASSVGGISFSRTGTVSGVADGYGDLVMPYGTVSGVLRTRVTESYTEIYNGTSSITFDATVHTWWKPGTPTALLIIRNVEINGIPTSQTLSWLQGGPVGMKERLTDDVLDVFPVPASDLVLVDIHRPGIVRMRLLDAEGRTVRSGSWNGMTRQTMDVRALMPGTYVLHTDTEGGHRAVHRVVVVH